MASGEAWSGDDGFRIPTKVRHIGGARTNLHEGEYWLLRRGIVCKSGKGKVKCAMRRMCAHTEVLSQSNRYDPGSCGRESMWRGTAGCERRHSQPQHRLKSRRADTNPRVAGPQDDGAGKAFEQCPGLPFLSAVLVC